jgi:hypothetical protein
VHETVRGHERPKVQFMLRDSTSWYGKSVSHLVVLLGLLSEVPLRQVIKTRLDRLPIGALELQLV